MERTVSVRLQSALLGSLDELRKRSRDTPLRGSQSAILRHALQTLEASWLRAPYIVERRDVFILVCRSADMFYWSTDRMFLNQRRYRVPCSIELKPEKVQEYIDSWRAAHESGVSEADWLRSKWLINYFAVWHGLDVAEDPDSSHVDEEGITVKRADLGVDLPEKAFVTREVIVGNEGYVQELKDGDVISDWGGIGLNVLTHKLKVSVLVDRELYAGDSIAYAEASVGMDLRNLDLALIRSDFAREESVSWHSGEGSLDSEHDAIEDAVLTEFGNFSRRLGKLSKPEVKDSQGRRVVRTPFRRRLLEDLRMPTRYLFGQLEWDFPYVGMEVCMTWHKRPELKADSEMGK